MVPIKQQLDPDDHYDGENNIEYIIVHGTGNKTDTDEGNANYFCTGSRNASAHDFVDDDSITQLVLDINGAWSVGDGANKYGINNHNSLNIEMCCTDFKYSLATQENTIELIRQKMKEHNVPIENVVRHYDASRKNCPSGFSDNNWAEWFAFKARIASGDTIQVSPGQVFRIRKSWNDIKSQIGAYTILENAKSCVNSHPGYIVFSGDGKQVYPANPEPAPLQPSTPSYNIIPFNANILSVQQVLNRLGFKGSNGLRLTEDGKNGINTDYAIRKFQTTMGITVDGDPQTQTWIAFNQILSKPYDTPPAPHYEYATRYIKWRIGMSVNGIYNDETANQVRIWQGNNGCESDGKIGPETWAKLIG